MENRRDIFQAISDPTRREIISMVARQSLNLNRIAEHFDMTRQAVSLHVKYLTECGLIVIRQEGRERYCEAKLEGLSQVSEWVAKFKKHWEQKLDFLEEYLEELQKIKKSKGHGKRRK